MSYRICCVSLIGILFLGSGCVHQYYNVATQGQETYFYSSEEEVKVGQSLSKQVEKAYKVDNDPLIQQRINAIGQRIVQANDRREIRYYFKVLAKKDINAFALPGGYIYMFRGLWDKISEDEAQIAAVLAHEVAHVAARHSIKRLQSSLGINILTILVVASSKVDSYSKAKTMAGINELMLAYSRSDEIQADTLATKYLRKAGYEMSAMIDVLDTLKEEERKQPVRSFHWRTHPYYAERKRAIKEQMHRGTIGFDDYINTAY